MSLSEILILSVALALDALIVSFSYGMILKENRITNSLKLALAVGFFQFLMPVLGWNFTGLVYEFIKDYSKWIVFTVFLFLGFKFIKEAFENEKPAETCCISFSCLMLLAIATSIDAFGAGVSIKCLNSAVLFPSVIIGIVTFLLSISGFFASYFFKKFPSVYIELTSALLLIYLAIKSVL